MHIVLGHSCLEQNLFGSKHRQIDSDSIPESYLVQSAWYAAICDVPKVDIAVLIGGQNFKIYTYERNKEFEEKLIKIACNFWYDHVEKRIPPNDGRNI